MSQIPGALGLTPAQVGDLLLVAGRAPSLHNSQPWRFHLDPTSIEMHAEPDRALPIADPDGREQRLACGAALFNLRLALHGHGIRPIVTIFPDPDRPDLIAVLRHGGPQVPTPELLALLQAIPARRTNRHPFSNEAVAATDLYALRRAAVDEGAWLYLVHEPAQRRALQTMASRAHDMQLADPAFRAELTAWSNVSSGHHYGVPARAAGPLPEPQDRWTLRDFTDGDGHARVPGKDFESDPVIAVLTSHLSGRTAEVQAGQALQRVLLTATANGLASSFVSQVVEVAQFREELRRLVGGTRPPQAVLRIGHGWPVSAVPRLPLDVLFTEPASASTAAAR